MKKSYFLNLLLSKTGNSHEEILKKQNLVATLEKTIGVKIDSYPAGTSFGIVEYIQRSVVGLGDLSHSQQIKLSLHNDGSEADTFEFALVSERSKYRELLENLQNKTGDFKSTTVIDHNQYRVIHSGSGGTLLGKADFHLYQIDITVLCNKVHAEYHDLLNFLFGNNHASIH